jgi:hypothetical protein
MFVDQFFIVSAQPVLLTKCVKQMREDAGQYEQFLPGQK